MKNFRRSERLVVITKILLESPNTIFPLGYFSDLFVAAKSSISEDLSIVKETMKQANIGHIETIAGAAGGVKFMPYVGAEHGEKYLQELALKLKEPSRILPGGYLYMTDIIFNPQIAYKVGQYFATLFGNLNPEYVVTVETKGIPLAMETARSLNIPIVILRNDSRVTEGSSVSINYVSGSSKKIRTMSLTRRALPVNAKVIIIDDFMKAGGTAKGIVEMMDEFSAQVLGIGVLVGTTQPVKKMVESYKALIELEEIDEANKLVKIKPVWV